MINVLETTLGIISFSDAPYAVSKKIIIPINKKSSILSILEKKKKSINRNIPLYNKPVLVIILLSELNDLLFILAVFSQFSTFYWQIVNKSFLLLNTRSDLQFICIFMSIYNNLSLCNFFITSESSAKFSGIKIL